MIVFILKKKKRTEIMKVSSAITTMSTIESVMEVKRIKTTTQSLNCL